MIAGDITIPVLPTLTGKELVSIVSSTAAGPVGPGITATTAQIAMLAVASGDIRNFCVSSSVLDQTTQVAAWLASAATYSALTIPANFDVVTATQTLPVVQGFSLEGAGISSVFHSRDGGDIFYSNAPELWGVHIGGFLVHGVSKTAGNAYGLHLDTAFVGFNWRIHHIYSTAMGGGGVRVQGQLFSTVYEYLESDGDGGHNIDIVPNNTIVVRNLYMHGAPRVGNDGYAKAAYRIRGGCVLQECNGVDDQGVAMGQIWGIFGRSTTPTTVPAVLVGGGTTIEADVIDAGGVVVLDNCNLESWKTVGIVSINGSFSTINGTGISGPDAAAGGDKVLCAYMVGGANPNAMGFIQEIGYFTPGAATFYGGGVIGIYGANTVWNYIGGQVTNAAATFVDMDPGAGALLLNHPTSSIVQVGYQPTGGHTVYYYAKTETTFLANILVMTAVAPPAAQGSVGLPGQVLLGTDNVLYINRTGSLWGKVAINMTPF